MDWSVVGQGVAAGLGAAVPVAVGIAWAIRKVFKLGRWKETLATKDDLAALQEANEVAHAGISVRIDDTLTEVSELKSTVASLVTIVEATRSDVGRILDHLLGSKHK